MSSIQANTTEVSMKEANAILKGWAIAQHSKIEVISPGQLWRVPSQKKHAKPRKYYTVSNDVGNYLCDCPVQKDSHHKCKHIWGVHYYETKVLVQQKRADQRALQAELKRPSRPNAQKRAPGYSKARAQREGLFIELLDELIKTVSRPVHAKTKAGRQIDWQSATLAVLLKVYEDTAADSALYYYGEAVKRGAVRTEIKSVNTILNHMNHPDMELVLKGLIKTTARPLFMFEDVLAVDSTGFTGNEKISHFDRKYNSAPVKHYTTAHMACGVRTKIIAACEITSDGDAPTFATVFKEAITNLNVKSVLADKAYCADYVYELIAANDMRAYIEHQVGHTGSKAGNAFKESLKYFRNNQEDFYHYYNQRSCIESAFSMMKRTFGTTVRSKNDQAMTNEVLAKVVCHNLYCLIDCMLVRGIPLDSLRNGGFQLH